MGQKDEWRDEKLKYSSVAESVVQKKIAKFALSMCKKQSDTLAECTKNGTLKVLWSCQDEVKGLNDCLGIYTKDEKLYETVLADYNAKRAEKLRAVEEAA